MKDLFRYLKSLIPQRDTVTTTEVVQPDLPHVSGCVNFFWDSESGDFNVILNVDERTDDSAEILGMLMCYIGSGHMSQFLLDSLKFWCDSPDKMEFYTNTLKTWNIMSDLQEAEQKQSEDRPLVDPSDVFRPRSHGDVN